MFVMFHKLHFCAQFTVSEQSMTKYTLSHVYHLRSSKVLVACRLCKTCLNLQYQDDLVVTWFWIQKEVSTHRAEIMFAFISSRLGWCSALFVGFPTKDYPSRVQPIQSHRPKDWSATLWWSPLIRSSASWRFLVGTRLNWPQSGHQILRLLLLLRRH